jgi:hypothetical protein
MMAALVYLCPFLWGVWAPGETPKRCPLCLWKRVRTRAVGTLLGSCVSLTPALSRRERGERRGSKIIGRLQIAD